jgi:oligopeptide/dipeptide ABC transporter ATP-binding protein
VGYAEDVPGDPRIIHPRAEQRNQHGDKEEGKSGDVEEGLPVQGRTWAAIVLRIRQNFYPGFLPNVLRTSVTAFTRKVQLLSANSPRGCFHPWVMNTIARMDVSAGNSSYDGAMAPLIEIRRLTVELPTPHGWICPVNDISLQLEPGESLGLVGESGSGKSMLALAIMGLLPPGAKVSGEAWFSPLSSGANSRVNLLTLPEPERVATRGRDIAMIFQEPMTALNPVMRVGTQIAEAIQAHHHGLRRDEVHRRVLAALERAAVPEAALRERQHPHQLSGGLRQRVMIAMALAAGSTWSPRENSASRGDLLHTAPRLLIADEPTTALDGTVQKQILDLLAHLRRDLGLTLLFITHDLGIVAQVADRIAVTYAGRIVEEGMAQEVLETPRHPYTAGLLRASPTLVRQKLHPIPGTVPPLADLPSGCAFEPRCPVRIRECTHAMPELRLAATDHLARCILIESLAPHEVAP